MTLRIGEIVLIRMRFHQFTGSKVRPAVVLLDTGDDDFVAAPVTSQSRLTNYDFAIDNWQAAGLNVPSTIRIHKLSVLAKADIARTVGMLTETDHTSFIRALCNSFCPSRLGQTNA